jgi:peptidoglycan hydrolase-like protein with peptidoglycan-binding domain
MTTAYNNPLRACNPVPGRIDQGVDYTCSGPAYALGPSIITVATANSGWPGGGAVVGKLTSGPLAGHSWYITEDIAPAVSVGDSVTSNTIVGYIGTNGAPGPWIETGWAAVGGGDGTLATQRGDADPNTGTGEWSTAEGYDYSKLLAYLGCAPGFLSTSPHGSNPFDSVALMRGGNGKPTNVVLQPGSSGPDVVFLQQDLNTWHASPVLTTDGSFGPNTEAALKAWETAHHMRATGKTDSYRWTLLNHKPTDPLPAPGSLVDTLNGLLVTLAWGPAYALQYHVQVMHYHGSSVFGTPVLDEVVSVQSVTNLTLPGGGQYAWRVQAVPNGTWSHWKVF